MTRGSRATIALIAGAAQMLILSACGSLVGGSLGSAAPIGSTEPSVLGTTQVAPDLPILRVGALQVETLDPSYITSDTEREIASLLYTPLVLLDELSRPGPGAALQWRTTDNLVWTFDLDPGGVFHNGEPVTAMSFIDGITFLADPSNLVPNSYLGLEAGILGFEDVARGESKTIAGLEAVDALTLQMTLSHPNSLLPSLLANESFSPRPSNSLADSSGLATRPNGNGPFSIVGEWDGRSAIELQPVDGGAHVVRFEFFDTIENMYRDRTLDVSHVPARQREALRKMDDSRLIERTSGTYNYLAFPMDLPPYDNPQVRQALSLALDRDRLIKTVFDGGVAGAFSFTPASAPGSIHQDCKPCRHDIAEARRLAAEAGVFEDGVIELAFNTGRDHEAWMQEVGAQWSEVFGVDVRFTSDGAAPYFEAVRAGTLPGPYRLKWSTDFAHAMSFLEPLFVGQDEATVGYNNQEITEIADRLLSMSDPYSDDGSSLISLITEQLNTDMPIIPVFASVGARVVSPSVDGVHLNLDGSAQLRSAILAE